METNKPLQLDFVSKVKINTLTWAKAADIRLQNIEVVIPFSITDKELSVWLFFDSDDLVQMYSQNGTVERVKQHYLTALKDLNYPEDYLSKVLFCIDSHENVKKNFQESYFNRLR